MSLPDLSSVVGLGSRICPARGFARSLERTFASMLSSAGLYFSSGSYSRFALSMLFYPAPAEIVLLAFYGVGGLFFVGPLVLVQAAPFLFPVVRAQARRRSIDAELPFFLVSMTVFSHESSPSLQDGLSAVASLGDGVLPYTSRESALLERNLTYLPGAPTRIIESTFSNHPSRRMREFVHAFVSTLNSSKSPVQFMQEEASRHIGLLDSAWSAFTSSLGSIAELSFMILALFPVGLQMVATALPGVGTSQLLLLSYLLLIIATLGLLAFIDGIQPLQHDTPVSPLGVLVTVAAWGACTFAYYVGALDVRVALAISLIVGLVMVRGSVLHLRRIRRGEEEISLFLHDLAEESKSGRSLPEAIDRVSERAVAYSSIRDAFLTFSQSIRLGDTPANALKKLRHPSWLVRVSFGVLSLAYGTGAGFEQLERLSVFFKRVTDARRNAFRSLLPFVGLGVAVPAISLSALSFLSGLTNAGFSLLTGSAVQLPQTLLILSILITSFLTGTLLSKLYTSSLRYVITLPFVLISTLVCLFIFGVG